MQNPVRTSLSMLALLATPLVGCGKNSTSNNPDSVAGMAGGGGPAGMGQGGNGATGGTGGSLGGGRGGTSVTDWPIDAGTNDGPFEWIGVIGTGQSLGVGCQSYAQNTTQPFNNVMLHDNGPDPKYPVDGAASADWVLTPLVEPFREHVAGYGENDPQYPNNACITNGNYGETPHSAFANTLSALWAERGNGDYVTAHSVVARGGACMAQINKQDSLGGGRTYAAGISEATVFKQLADDAGKSYGVAAILMTHGECDSSNPPYNPEYGAQLYQLWSDYNTDIKAITGQSRNVVMFASQQSGLPAGYNGPNVQLWRTSTEHPDEIVCVGPKYAYGNYGIHLPNAPAYIRLGEKYAEVYDYVVNRGAPWRPVGPNRVTRSGAVITIDMDVPNPPLVWDTHLAAPHQDMHTAWARGRGFEVVDQNGTEIEIASAEIQGTSVILTLAQAPANGTSLTLAYGLTQDGEGSLGGYSAGMHGQLRDSDDFKGFSGETLEVTVRQGSDMVTSPAGEGAFVRRANLDIVSGPGVPEGMVVLTAGTYLTISEPWPGESGVVSMTFHHNHYNYCVHFATPVP